MTLYRSRTHVTAMIPYIDIHTHNRTVSCDVKAVFNRDYDEETVPFCSIGIHPYLSVRALSSPDFIDRSIAQLRRKATSDEVIAIGEAGLDSTRGADMDTQTELFRRQVEVAEEVGKPLVIHCVRQYDEIIRVQRRLKPVQTWIVHGFRKNGQTARQLIGQGMELSFGNRYNAEALQLAYSSGHLWLETDESGMDIRDHYGNVAAVLGVSVEELKLRIYSQAVRLSSAFLRE